MIRLPNAATAVVPPEKIRDYLLAPGHAQNQGKAEKFFRFGFRANEWELLAAALGQHAIANDVVKSQPSAHGVKFVVRCHLQTPDGRNPCIRSVWAIDWGKTSPRLVSAY